MPNASEFRKELQRLFRYAERRGLSHVDVNAGEVHRRLGGYPKRNHQMPTCCSVMWQNKGRGDTIVKSPPRRQGATLTIRYRIPR